MASAGFGSQSQLCRQFGICGLNQKGVIRKNDGGNYSFALVFFDDKLFSLRVFLDIHPIVWNLMLTQKLFAASAIRAPMSPVNGNIIF
jgi:hypothetical protein